MIVPLPQAGGVRGGPVVQRLLDHDEHPFDILQNIVVPEAQNSIAAAHQKACPPLVFDNAPGMLPAVQLNDELRCSSREIADEWSDRYLAIEAYRELTVTNVLPKLASAGVALLRSSRERRVGSRS